MYRLCNLRFVACRLQLVAIFILIEPLAHQVEHRPFKPGVPSSSLGRLILLTYLILIVPVLNSCKEESFSFVTSCYSDKKVSAGVAELADAHGLGPCPLWVGVQISPSA